MRTGMGAALTALALSCGAARPGPDTERGAMDPQAPAVTISVDKMSYAAGETIVATLVAANRGAAQLDLRFATTQRYDFAITDSSGREVWRWGADRGFGQALGVELIEPAGRLAWVQRFRAPSVAGAYRLAGTVVTMQAPLTASTGITVTP